MAKKRGKLRAKIIVQEDAYMSNMDNTTFLKGLGVGMVVGSALGMVMRGDKKEDKNAWGKALKSMGEVVENVSGVLGL